ncbi:hypothetical protein X737_37185 [Mesorhizobium sp. L48C026A00]|nr:hypothetical protein X737_37185 [Mesorhizobium sp. L48C026A00]
MALHRVEAPPGGSNLFANSKSCQTANGPTETTNATLLIAVPWGAKLASRVG